MARLTTINQFRSEPALRQQLEHLAADRGVDLSQFLRSLAIRAVQESAAGHRA